MIKRSIIFLGTAASAPQQNRFTQSIAVCGSRECVLLDIGEGTQVRLLSAGIDHRRIDIVSVTHIHGDHIHGLLPFIESLEMKLSTQKTPEKHILRVLAPTDFCRYLDVALDTVITESAKFDRYLDIVCIDATTLSAGSNFVESSSGEIRITPIPVEHGISDAYGYYVSVDIGKNVLGIFYSGDGLCNQICMERLKQLKPSIVIHEATFLDYLNDRTRACESRHSTVYEAAKLAQELEALVLILTHISARYGEIYLRDFVSRARRIFRGSIIIAEDLAKIPLAILSK